MSEGEARMEELSAQFREVKVAHDELVGRKASLQVRWRFLSPHACTSTQSCLEFPPLRCKLGRSFELALLFCDTDCSQTSAHCAVPVQADVATLELALAKADAEAAAVRERLATPPQPAAKVCIAAATLFLSSPQAGCHMRSKASERQLSWCVEGRNDGVVPNQLSSSHMQRQRRALISRSIAGWRRR